MKKIYKTIYLCLLTAVLCPLTSFSQTASGIEWQNTIGGNTNDYLTHIQQASDGGYILGGHSQSNISGDKIENSLGSADYWVLKLDVTGNIQWQSTIGGTDWDALTSFEQTTDGGYILGGISYSNISGDKTENSLGQADYWVIKLDSIGNIQWQNTIGGNNFDYLELTKQTDDGGYILGGYSNSNISGDKTENSLGYFDYWIVKIDSIGNIQWQNTIGGSKQENIHSIQPTTDGGYVLGGFSDSDSSGDKTEHNWDTTLGTSDYWIVKLDSSGNIQWQNTIGGSDDEQLVSICQTADGGFVLGGFSDSDSSGDKTENCIGGLYHTDYWLVKLDSVGNIHWQNTIGGILYDYLQSVNETNDGGYFLAGKSVSNVSGDKTENCIGEYDYWVIKLDTNGNIIWQNTIGGSNQDFLIASIQTGDGGYIFGGYSNSDVSGDKTENSQGSWDYWVVKLAPDTITSIVQFPNYPITISVFPNPITDKLNITINNNDLSEIILYDMTSRKLLQQKFTNTVTLNTAQLAKGIYIYEVRNENGVIKKGKVVKE